MRGLGISGGVYAVLCGVLPLAWGLAAAWLLQRLPSHHRENRWARARSEAGTQGEEYHI